MSNKRATGKPHYSAKEIAAVQRYDLLMGMPLFSRVMCVKRDVVFKGMSYPGCGATSDKGDCHAGVFVGHFGARHARHCFQCLGKGTKSLHDTSRCASYEIHQERGTSTVTVDDYDNVLFA